jgi:cellulose synthase/poly-beta-1,6-N-acetylglucosamine synthase-like glycosyltransferase
VFERESGERGGKAAALAWLFSLTLQNPSYDAVVVFDADTQVDTNFLKAMNARLCRGYRAVQGQHIISNPEDGWFPALAWALLRVDNRFQNLGRTNLGFSAKNMGDSICLSADLLREFGWGSGLTEDYNLRQKMLLAGVPIYYEPEAIAFGEAPRNWSEARVQRARWLRGTHDSSRGYTGQLLEHGLRQKNPVTLEGAIQGLLPSYSSLTMIGLLITVFCLGINLIQGSVFPAAVFETLVVILLLLFLYPLLGLALDQAPPKAYLAILTGPVYIVWRTLLAISSRYGQKRVVWIRTPHGGRGEGQ